LPQGACRRQERNVEVARADRLDDRPDALGRGLGAARVFTQDGTLVASVAQEGMVRFPD